MLDSTSSIEGMQMFIDSAAVNDYLKRNIQNATSCCVTNWRIRNVWLLEAPLQKDMYNFNQQLYQVQAREVLLLTLLTLTPIRKQKEHCDFAGHVV